MTFYRESDDGMAEDVSRERAPVTFASAHQTRTLLKVRLQSLPTSDFHPIKEYYYFPSSCFIVVTIKTCMGWLGRKFLLCYFPLAVTEELEEAWTFLAGIMGSVMISAF